MRRWGCKLNASSSASVSSSVIFRYQIPPLDVQPAKSDRVVQVNSFRVETVRGDRRCAGQHKAGSVIVVRFLHYQLTILSGFHPDIPARYLLQKSVSCSTSMQTLSSRSAVITPGATPLTGNGNAQNSSFRNIIAFIHDRYKGSQSSVST